MNDGGATRTYLERLRAALAREPRAAEILAEVEDHLAESRAALVAAGFPAGEAEAEALRRYGDVAEVAAAHARARREIRRSRLVARAAALWWLAPALAVMGHPLGWWLRDAAAAGGGWRALAGLLSFGTPAVGLFVLLTLEERPGELAAGRHRRALFWGKVALLSPVLLLALQLALNALSAPPGWLLPLWRAAAAAAMVASPILLRAPRPRRGPAGPPAKLAPLMGHVRRAHAISAAVMVAFAALHLGSHLAAFWSIAVNRAVSAMVRPIYAQGAFEALVVTAIAVQAATGLLILGAGTGSRRRAPEKLQALSGLYLGAFVVVHALAVLVVLRGVRLDFLGSTGGTRGLLGSHFLPCYALAPLAFFVHLASGLRRLAPARLGRVLARSTLVGGIAVSVAITLAMAGWHVRNDRTAAAPLPKMAAR